MAMTTPDSALQRRARELYQRASREVDPATAGRLRAARRTALLATRESHTRRMLLPTGAFAVIALAAMFAWPTSQHSTRVPSPIVAMSSDVDNDLPPDADSADPALYQNLDFYGWLASSDSGHASR
jgi:hypothetical protein